MEPGFYKKFFEIEKNHWLMKVRRLIILDVLKKYVNKPNETKLLDFGCASGYFAARLAELGYQSFGLDSSVEAIESGRRDGVKNLKVIGGQRIDFPDNFFNVVLLLDVLEHLEDESWALKEVERVLALGGVVIVTVPAFRFLWGVHDEVARHFRRYTMPKLARAIRSSSNLSIVRKTYFNTLLFIPIALVRLFCRWFNLKNRESDFDINNRLLNKIFFWIINFERLLIRHLKFPFGVSILMVLKKC